MPEHERRHVGRPSLLTPAVQETICAAIRQGCCQCYATGAANRAGIEGTISHGGRTFGLRRARFVGQRKTHLHHLLTAAALNFVRVGLWLTGVPHATTPLSPFASGMTMAA